MGYLSCRARWVEKQKLDWSESTSSESYKQLCWELRLRRKVDFGGMPAVGILLTTAKCWGPETVSWRGSPGGIGSLQLEENAFLPKERNMVFYKLPVHWSVLRCNTILIWPTRDRVWRHVIVTVTYIWDDHTILHAVCVWAVLWLRLTSPLHFWTCLFSPYKLLV